MNKTTISIIIGAILIAGIIGGVWWFLGGPESHESKCGDGVCDARERKKGICFEDCGSINVFNETCGPNNNGYCIDFREECKEGYEGIGPDSCSAGRSAECCVPVWEV